MSNGSRIAIGIVAALGSLGFVLVGHILQYVGHEMPAGMAPIYALAAACAAVAFLCFYAPKAVDSTSALLGINHTVARDANWVARKRAEFGAFKVSDLNLVGWLLLLSSFALVIGVSFVVGFYSADETGGDHETSGPGLTRIAAIPTLILAIGWFQVARYLLQRSGISILRDHAAKAPSEID